MTKCSTYLNSLVIMEPSHQPYNVRGARALAEAFPGLPQVACFDTSFHRTMPEVAQIYALPKDVRDAGVRHWGYHGISYDYISRQVAEIRTRSPTGDRRTSRRWQPACAPCWTERASRRQWASPASPACQWRRARATYHRGCCSICCAPNSSTTLRWRRCSTERSGLLGLSGISEDMRDLQASTIRRATAAIAFFVYAMTKYVGAYASVLGGLDALVFTAGIGENSAPVRAGLCRALGWLGVKLDAAANAHNGPRISTGGQPGVGVGHSDR